MITFSENPACTRLLPACAKSLSVYTVDQEKHILKKEPVLTDKGTEQINTSEQGRS